MGGYRDLYEFAAKAGAFEGYVYHREKVDLGYLPRWIDNLVDTYHALSPEVRGEIQDLCDRTLGRAVQSLVALLGEDHALVNKLKDLIGGEMPDSPDDFERS
jgi:hypothetical protein